MPVRASVPFMLCASASLRETKSPLWDRDPFAPAEAQSRSSPRKFPGNTSKRAARTASPPSGGPINLHQCESVSNMAAARTAFRGHSGGDVEECDNSCGQACYGGRKTQTRKLAIRIAGYDRSADPTGLAPF